MPRGVYDRSKSKKGARKQAKHATAAREATSAVEQIRLASSKALQPANKPDIRSSGAEMEQDFAANEAPEGYVPVDAYDDLLERFHNLQLDLADRDVLIAEMQLEITKMRRTALANVQIAFELKNEKRKGEVK